MFGSSLNFDSSSSGSGKAEIIQSGYDIMQPLEGLPRIRQEFKESLSLRESDFNEQTLMNYANSAGKIKAMSDIAAKVSKQKLDTANALLRLQSVMFQHTQGALSATAQWEKNMSQNLQQMSTKLLDMNVVRENHAGFSQYIDTAERIIRY